MKLLGNQLDKQTLSKFGEEACRLFIARDFQALADTFDYAMAYDRNIAAAIEADFEDCLSGHCPSPGTQDAIVKSITVKNFQPNDAGLLSVIECVLAVDREAQILIELIVAKNSENTNLYLEDINIVS